MRWKDHTINMLDLTFGTSKNSTVEEVLDAMKASPFSYSLATFSDEKEDVIGCICIAADPVLAVRLHQLVRDYEAEGEAV